MSWFWEMWAKYPHTLQPLTRLTSNKVKFKWTGIKKRVFDEVILIVAHNTSFDYPGFNIKFDIYIFMIVIHN